MNEIMTLFEKRKFIKNFISTQASNEVTIDIISLLDHSNIARTSNKNGLFINLSLLKEDIIEDLYSLCRLNMIDTKNVKSPVFIQSFKEGNKEINDFVYTLDKISFTPIDNFILDLSKEHIQI
jgi:hypothetical protein